VFTEPSDGQGIYDKELVLRGLDALRQEEGKLIDEAHISDWLDRVYQGDVASAWENAYNAAYREFVGACLVPLRAFNSSDSLEDAFYKAFDSVEVLPMCLQKDFERLKLVEPLVAQELLVPVRWGQFAQLLRKGRARRGGPGEPSLVDAAYDCDRGLQLT